MANILKGKPVNEYIDELNSKNIKDLLSNNIKPAIATIRIGNKEDDIAYERSINKKAEKLNVIATNIVLEDDVTSEDVICVIKGLNEDNSVQGIILFRPLNKKLDEKYISNSISPNKDLDGANEESLSAIFLNKEYGFAPCTVEAIIKILEYYNIEIEGKNIVVAGRSLVVGKPLSMLLLNKNATVTICHSKTKDLKKYTRNADIVVAAIGKMHYFDKSYFKEDQTIIDVGIHYDENEGKLCGDVLFDEVKNVAKNITPVPGGIGSITTSILFLHLLEAIKRR